MENNFNELINQGLTELEAYDVLIYNETLYIDELRQKRKKLIKHKNDNLNQISLDV